MSALIKPWTCWLSCKRWARRSCVACGRQASVCACAAPAHAGQARLSIRQRGDWFAVNGELALEDDGRLLQLRELLTLVGQHSGRYVRLAKPTGWRWTTRCVSNWPRWPAPALGLDADGAASSAGWPRRCWRNWPTAPPLVGDAGWTAQRALASAGAISPPCPAPYATLRDYQLAGFHWLARLAHWGVGACLADDMGLGKTMQTLALCLLRAEHGPQLVVAPPRWRKTGWPKPPALPQPAPAAVCPATRAGRAGAGDLVVVSYGLFLLDAERFAQVHWASVILDEAQAIKTGHPPRPGGVCPARRFSAGRQRHPVENHLGELWSFVSFSQSGFAGSLEQFGERFATPIAEGDEPARLALRRLLQPFILRRTKTQVLTELPLPRTELTYRVELSDGERELYAKPCARRRWSKWRKRPSTSAPCRCWRTSPGLRRLCCHPPWPCPTPPCPAASWPPLPG